MRFASSLLLFVVWKAMIESAAVPMDPGIRLQKCMTPAAVHRAKMYDIRLHTRAPDVGIGILVSVPS